MSHRGIVALILIKKLNMKLFIIFFSLLTSTSFYAQNSLSISFNRVHTGNNISVRHSLFSKGKNELAVGLKYHFNRYPIHHENNLFYKAIDAKNFIQHLGPDVRYKYNFKKLKSENIIYLYSNVQYTYAGTSNVFYNPIGNKIYKRIDVEFTPMHMIEQHIGIGLSTKLTNNIYFNINCGIGAIFLWNIDERIWLGAYHHDWSVARGFSVGLNYKYGKTNKKN